jgi:autophagy-related protein 2
MVHFLPNVINIHFKFVQAYESLTDGLGRTASALIGNPIKVYNRGGGPGSVLATAICGAPAAAVAPVSASARAVHYTLLGLRNR